MNFLLLRSNSQTVAQDETSVNESQSEAENASNKVVATLAGLIGEDFSEEISSEAHLDIGGCIDEYDMIAGCNVNGDPHLDSHMDLNDNNGFIIIPSKKVPNNWTEATDVLSYQSLDRSFVFPGERIQILACLPGPKQDTEIITPFKVASMIHEKRIGSPAETITEVTADTSSVMQRNTENGRDAMTEGQTNTDQDIATAESLIRLEDHRNQTEKVLQSIKKSHFFARIVELNEDLKAKRRSQLSGSVGKRMTGESAKAREKNSIISSMIDGGDFNGRTSGGLARGAIEYCSLSNGDIVVLLQVNVGVECLRDPVLEIVQFVNHEENTDLDGHVISHLNDDPSKELLKWLLPLDNSLPPSARPKSPPVLSTSSSIRGTSTKSNGHGSSGSQIFSFGGHFRSYSMSSLPQTTALPPQAVTAPTTKHSSFDPEDWNQFSFMKYVKMGKSGNEGLLSFRGMPLEPRRFSARCGLEGIFTYARSWRRMIQLIHPIEIQSSSFDCNTNDLICVQVKNLCPENAPDIVMFIDSVCLIVEEPLNGGLPVSVPVTTIEAGDGCGLPNLMLRRGEEHCFLLKPATTYCSHPLSRPTNILQPEHGSGVPSSLLSANSIETQDGSLSYQCSVVVSCRCNYTESKLSFKQPTSWRPRISKDLLVSVTSETSKLTLGPDGTQLPVQVLNLEVSNRTSEDLTMTLVERVNNEQKVHNSVSVNEELAAEFDVVSGSSEPGCTHLWLRSNVSLGCIPSHSMTTMKLEVLPLSDGIISLDSLQIDVKEKDVSYIPEHTLKINAT